MSFFSAAALAAVGAAMAALVWADSTSHPAALEMLDVAAPISLIMGFFGLATFFSRLRKFGWTDGIAGLGVFALYALSHGFALMVISMRRAAIDLNLLEGAVVSRQKVIFLTVATLLLFRWLTRRYWGEAWAVISIFCLLGVLLFSDDLKLIKALIFVRWMQPWL